MNPDDRTYDVSAFFAECLHEKLHDKLGVFGADEVEQYLSEMLSRFLSFDKIYSIRDAQGQRLTSLASMLAEGDIRQNATSFEREREVHRHIGDFLLFWSGMFPEYLKASSEPLVEVEKQGSFSYHVVSTFDYDPHSTTVPMFKKLSEGFDVFREGLNMVRKDLWLSA